MKLKDFMSFILFGVNGDKERSRTDLLKSGEPLKTDLTGSS